MTMKRSSIVAPQEELDAFYTEMKGQSLTPLWAQELPAGRSDGPRGRRAVPHVWQWQELRPLALRATELVGTQEAERRVLTMVNPGPGASSAADTLVAAIQVVMPGEIARAHRHTMAALRMVIESGGGYTVVNGEAVPMLPGDLVLTPGWTWHDHANDSAGPMIWLDGLDVPMVTALEAAFQENYVSETQPVREEMDVSFGRYGAGGLRPAWGEQPYPGHSPLMHYPWPQTKATLDRLSRTETGSACDGVILEYTNPVTGGPVMPTMGCYVQSLKPKQHTEAHRHTGSTIYHVVEGEGYSIVDGRRLEWSPKDTFCVPSWSVYEHVNASSSSPAYLFSYTSAPVLRALFLYREEAVER